MRLLACFAVMSVMSIATIGCSSEDVYIHTESTRSGLSCQLAAGEDICTRDWNDVDPAQRTKTLALLGSVTSFAGQAQEMLSSIELACTELAGKLEIAVPLPTATVGAQATATCKAVSSAITKGRSGSWTVKGQPGSCTPTSAPSCIPTGTPRVSCTPASVTLVVPETATDDERALAAKVEASFAKILEMKARLEVAVQTSGTFATNLDGDVPTCVVPAMTTLVDNALQDVKLVAELTSTLAGSLEGP